MDSKNLIWLSSFFSLLFITFCVTNHLDDLNPHITSIPQQHQELSSELEVVHLNEDRQNFTPKKVEKPIVIQERTELLSTDTLRKNTHPIKREIEKVTPKPIMIKKATKPKSSKKVKKEKITISSQIVNSKKPNNKTKNYTIGSIYLDTSAIEEIKNHKNHNELNKLAYIHNMNKNSFLIISTKDRTNADKLKNYLHRQNVKKEDVKIVTDESTNNLIKITLIGRK